MIKINNKAVLFIICSIVCGAIVSCGNVFAEDVTYEVDVATGINITIPTNTVTLNLTPTNVASFKSSDLPVTVKTNNPTGYTLTMSPSDATTTSLTRTGGTETIPTLADLSGGYTEQTFTTNKWGYKLSSTNYLPFTTSNEITTTNAPTAASGNTSTVTFAAKGDTTLMSGAYNLEITFTAVANYVPPATIDYCAQNSIADANCMQKMVASNCTTTAKTVMDSRDGEQYLVQELADGNCWLIDNLRLDLSDSNVLANTAASNTNASAISLNYLKNGGGTASDQYAMSSIENLTLGDSYSNPRVNASYKNYIDPDSSKNYGAGSHKYGVIYNTCAGSAGSYCYGDGTDPGTPVGDGSEDICPAGWRVPTGGANTVATDGKGEYQALYEAYNSNTTNFRNALSIPVAGTFVNGETKHQGVFAFIGSSTKYDGSDLYCLIFHSSNAVSPQDHSSRSYGGSVRCLLK